MAGGRACADPRAPSRSTLSSSLRTLAITGAAAAACAAGASAQTAQSTHPLGRFPRIYSGAPFKPATVPVGAQAKQRVTVVVQMSDDPIAVVRANAPNHRISAAQHHSVAAAVDAQQAGVLPAITGSGGRVLARFHGALNGIKVRIDHDQIESLKSLPGVTAVLPVRTYHLDNAESVPFIGAPQVWQGVPGYRGEGVKVAIIDTGVDYTQADFGGPGTVAAYQAALATDAAPPDPTLVGPNAPKVKGGIDLAGDAYDASDPTSVPQPDANPLDCNSHGTHTAGTLAGFGITTDGKTYTGPYDAAAYTQGFLVGPGVAPKADLYSVKIFGCGAEATTNLTVDAIDWAIDNDMNVISMSLGSDFGTSEDADEIAVRNATNAGIIVVAASGNSGPIPYVTSSPGGAASAISVAAMDSHLSYPGAQVKLDSGTVELQDSNGAAVPSAALPVVVLHDATQPGGISLGCNDTDYTDPNTHQSIVAGKLVITQRGVCARILRAQLGQAHGAAAVVMINTSPGYPVYEGPIPGVTIPFFGSLPTDEATLVAATTASSFTANTISNPTYRTAASFSSQGPRFGDSLLKPNVTAPGVSIFSAGMGTGNGGLYDSGTSMSTPHVAGVAALAFQSHPGWNERQLSAAIVETADPTVLTDYTPSIEGAGGVQAVGAAYTQAVVLADTTGGEHAVSFGFDEFLDRYQSRQRLTVVNNGDRPIVFDLSATPTSAVQHTARLNELSVFVPAHGRTPVELTLSVPASNVGGVHDSIGNVIFNEVSGYLTFTPAVPTMNGGVTLHVPYYLVPRARANVQAILTKAPTAKHPVGQVQLLNVLGGVTGFADFFEWGLAGPRQGMEYYDTRAAGVMSFTGADPQNPLGDPEIVFAINTYPRFSSPEAGEFDVLIDVNGDGKPDYDLVGIDLGLLTSGTFSGVYASVVYDLNAGEATVAYLADAPTDGSTVLLPVFAQDLGLTTSSPAITYTETTTNLFDGSSETLPGSASFNVFAPAISSGFNVALGPNGHAAQPVAIDPAQWAKTPAKGLMIVVEDNHSGAPQAALLPVGGRFSLGGPGGQNNGPGQSGHGHGGH
ncbi:MAG TPA: S8 family serine peptidase [Steroidobacteraceae bacterium]|nr:S8 family serine peptidase [Steroidobacteraceae bacterium]